MITRRSITKSLAAGAGLLGFLGLNARADAPKAKRRAKAIGPHQTPTMELLLNIVELDKDDPAKQKYYAKVLGKALEFTGPIRWELLELDQEVFALPNQVKLTSHRHYVTLPARSSFAVLIPDEVLPHIRYSERGEGFPMDVPFVELA